MENAAEVQELRNKLRMMKFPPDEILNTFRKQQRAIHKQRQANETIHNEIDEYRAQIDSYETTKSIHDSSEELNHLKSLEKSLTNKLGVLSADYAAEEQKRKALEEEVSKARSKVGGLYQQTRENEEIQGKIRTMENRLDKSLVRYNQNLTKLAEKRAQLDELRKDRFTYREVLKKAQDQATQLDDTIQNEIKASNEYYSQRDGLKMEIAELKANEEADIQNYEREMDRITQTIERQRIAAERPHEKQTSVPTIISQGGSSTETNDEIQRQTDEYQAKINKTLELLQMKSIDELFAEAEKLERENFSLFNFVVEHGATRSKLQDEIDCLELQHDKLIAQNQANDDEKAMELQQLTEDIKDAQNELDELEKQKQQNEQEFNEVYKEIDDLYNLLGCSWDSSPDEKATVTPANAMFALTNIETAINQIMDEVGKKAKSVYDVNPPDNKTTTSGDNTSKDKKSHIDIALDQNTKQSIETATRPLTLDEIRAKLSEDPTLLQ